MARKKEHFQDIAVQGLYAAGSFGTAGQVLKSDGDNVYWTNETIGDATTLDGYDSTAFAILASANKFTQPITVNVNPLTTGPALPTGTLLHLIGTNATQSRMYLDTFGANAAFLGRRANGTNAAPSAILSGDFIFTFGGFGYGTTGYIASASALGLVTATENFTDTAAGAKFSFRTIANGTITPLVRWHIENDGSLIAEGLTVTGNGTLNAVDYFDNGVNINTIYADATNTLTMANKTLTNPTINAAALSGTFSGAVTRTGIETFNLNAAAAPAAFAGTIIHVVQADAANPRILLDGFGAQPTVTLRRASGTNASKTAILSGEAIGNVNGMGYGSSGYSANSRVALAFLAAENWTDSAQGTRIIFSTSTNTTASSSTRWGIENDGSFVYNGGSVTGNGTVNAIDYFDNGVNINTIYASLGGSPSFSTITSTGMIYAVNGFSATSVNSFEPQLQLTNTNNDNTAGYLILNKNPADTTLATNDYLGTILFQGRGSSSIGQGVQIASTYRGTRGTNWVEANLQFGVTNSAGTMLWTYINSNGGITSDALGTVWGSLNDGAGTGLDADLLDGYDSLALAYGGRAQRLITGGGTIIVDASGYVLWTTRFIVISGGRGTTTATSGYFDINCPTSGTITGVGGAANVTATAAGIPLAAWQALYYILPLGSAETSLAANFRVVSYTSNVDIPEHWVLICTRNGDSTIFYFNNGIQLGLSDTYTAGTVWNSANDGSGSGLDADTLDGLNSNAFVYRGIGHGDAQTILLNRGLSATSGISFYSAAFTAWSLYMASSGTASNGPNGTVTAPSGNGVTQWALRSFIENVAGYGWTFESGTSATTTPTVVAEIRSSDGRIWSSAQGVLWGATNDGPGSGLDADTIDTIESNRIIYGINQSGSTGANPTQTFTELAQYKSGFWDVNAAAWTPDTGYWWGLTMAHISNGPSYNFGGQIIIQNSGGTPNAYLRSISGGGTPAATAWQRIWTSAVDGSGSGLDADTVDGYQATNLGRLAVAQSWTAQQTFDYDGTTIFNDPTGDYILQFNTAGTARGYVGADATYSFSVRNTGGSRLLSAINNSGIVEAFSLDATNGSVRILLATAGLQHFDGAGNYRWLEGVRSDITGNVNDWTLYNSAGGETIRAFHSTRVVNFPVNITIAGGTNWHAGNDGAGSGLDADTLDGYNIGLSGGTIGLLNGNNTYSGISTHTAEIRWTSPPINSRMLGMPWAEMSSDAGGNGVFGNNLYANWDGVSVTYRTVNTHGSVGYGAIRFGYGTTQVAAFGGATTADATVTPTWHTLWHSGSDGAGSGLDADLLDGLTSTQFLRSDIAQQGGIGYGTHDYNTYPSVYSVTFVNPTGSSNLPTGMGAVTAYRFIMAGGDTASRGVDIVATQENPYTNIFVRERTYGGWSKLWHNNNDGAGSGLDADLLDGYSSASFVFQNQAATLTTLSWTSVGGNSGLSNYDYAFYQEGGAWTSPFPDLVIAFHTGIKIMSATSYGGTRFYNNSPSYVGAADPLFIVGNIDNATSHISHAITSVTTDGFGLEFLINGAYVDGRYAHRLAKWDAGGGIPLYMQKTSSTAGAWTTIARFGSFTGNAREFEVFGPTAVVAGDNSYTTYGPNTGYGAYLHVGAGTPSRATNNASIVVTDGNLHIDSGAAQQIYLNYYTDQPIYAYRQMYYQGSYLFWHAVNDGAGSGLDADLLDGLNSSSAAGANTIVARDGNGYIFSNYINTTDDATGSAITYVMVKAGDNYHRSGSAALLRNFLAGQQAGAAVGFANWNTEFGNTAVSQRRWSGDTSGSTNGPGGSWWFADNMRHSNGTNTWGTQIAWGWEDNANRLKQRNVSAGTWSAWVSYWNDANDGSGSGLDADLFDGVNSTEYVFGAGGGYGTTGSLTNMNTGAKSGFFTSDNPTNGPFATWTQWINVRGAFWADGSQYVQQIAWNMFSTDMRIRNCSNGTWGSWYQIWHSNSDGSGSGLDADLWDGNDFATYLNQALLTSSSPSFAGLTITGAVLIGVSSTATDVNTANDIGSFSCRGDGTTGKVASMSFHRTGNYAINMGLGADNIFRIGGWSASSNCLQLTGAGALTTLSTITAGGSIYAGSGHWFRSTGDTGWYSETWGGGTYMTDGTYVKIYNGKAFYVGNNIDATGNITAYYSDERLKTKSRNVENALDQISTLTPFFYFENELARSLGYNNQEEQIGISAQEVQRILPQVVHRAPVDIAVDENNNKYSKSGEEYLTVDYAKLVPLLIAAVKELKAEIEELRRDASR